jgi:hypothetical protein
MVRIRYSARQDGPCRVVCHGHHATVYLRPDLTLPQRRAALLTAAGRGVTPAQIRRAAAADRCAAAGRALGRTWRTYPLTCVLILAMVGVGVATYVAYVTGSLPFGTRPASPAPAARTAAMTTRPRPAADGSQAARLRAASRHRQGTPGRAQARGHLGGATGPGTRPRAWSSPPPAAGRPPRPAGSPPASRPPAVPAPLPGPTLPVPLPSPTLPVPLPSPTLPVPLPSPTLPVPLPSPTLP